MTTATTIIALAGELETIDMQRITLNGQMAALDKRRTEILSQIAFAVGPVPSAAPPEPQPDPDPHQLTVPGADPCYCHEPDPADGTVPADSGAVCVYHAPPEAFGEVGPEPETKRSTARNGLTERVISALAACPSGMSIAALVAAAGSDAPSMRSLMSRLKKQGKATVISRGVWGPV